MDEATGIGAPGPFEARYLAFLETVTHIRPSLHRYCARMTGSVMDGEDVVQESLFQAYRKLDTFDDNRALQPWLFRIAHNRCIDFLRSRGVREEAEAVARVPNFVEQVEPAGAVLGHAIEHLVLTLPPKERACVLLKDVFDYSLDEIAELAGSTVGSVKAALNRGRSKLAILPEGSVPAHPVSAKSSHILSLYVERFNRRDWEGVRELIAYDARLRVADRFAGLLADSPYFHRYETATVPWSMVAGNVDGHPVAIVLHHKNGAWSPHSISRIDFDDHFIIRVVDYAHCPWILAAAADVHYEQRRQGSVSSAIRES